MLYSRLYCSFGGIAAALNSSGHFANGFPYAYGIVYYPQNLILRTMSSISNDAFLRVVLQIRYFSGGMPAFIAIDIVVFSFHSHIQVYIHITSLFCLLFSCNVPTGRDAGV